MQMKMVYRTGKSHGVELDTAAILSMVRGSTPL